MNKKLSDLTTLISGYSFRGAVPFDAAGNYRAVQVRDIDSDGQIMLQYVSPIDISDIKTDAVLQENDILLSVRGTEASGLKVGIYKQTDTKIIATSSLYILRVTDRSIFPEYLLYYLKSFYGQRALKSLMSGATIQTISKKDLTSMDIPIPPTSMQELIINTMNNIIHQKYLYTKKISLLQTLADNIMTTHV